MTPTEWMNRDLADAVPQHDGPRCQECGYPLTNEHDDGFRTGWLLCPCCDSYYTGEDEVSS